MLQTATLTGWSVIRQIEVLVRASVTRVGQKEVPWRHASLRFGGADEGVRPYTSKSPRSGAGARVLVGLEENLQTQLHVEGFSGSDAGGSVEVTDCVRDRAAARTCGT